MTLAVTLAAAPDRCAQGFHVTQHPAYCHCTEGSEWSIFVAALKQAKRADGSISQTDMRPLIKGRIEPNHIGGFYVKAKREHLIKPLDRERSTDHASRNLHHDQTLWLWIA